MAKRKPKPKPSGPAKPPAAFLLRMRALLGETEFAAFEKALSVPVRRGLRLNCLKCRDIVAFCQTTGFVLSPAPFADEGFYITGGEANGRHPWHHAGVFYLQEPSAMSAVAALDPRPGQRILDLCAAPGGKSTQIAARLGGDGLLVANEIISGRAKILLSNLERFGVRNACVYNETPERLCTAFSGFFDAVLVDAPCSGEGMFRREPAAAADWTPQTPVACAKRQLLILENAKKALRPGGVLVYSTCTFAPEENESVVAAFLKENPVFSLETISHAFGRPARPDWADGEPSLVRARRIFSQDGGEGHFVARLRWRADVPSPESGGGMVSAQSARVGVPEEDLLRTFFAEQFDEPLYGMPHSTGEVLFLLPAESPVLPRGLHLLRAGVCAGRVKNGRFEPAHALYLAAADGACRRTVELSLADPRLAAFLHGEQIEAETADGYTAVLAAGHVVGFGKVSGGTLKNHYPRALRTL
ncbi:RsmB/NOP family class I SAM-dependent RNA methyltransferase [Ethanoligenens sp.]|uniref:RsmB/NOP family class I SAM-dependent RNA methyltransferase n=1 Tax=Ethanoligenens sp. TaxID=2099655 RepID=UPI0039ECBF13